MTDEDEDEVSALRRELAEERARRKALLVLLATESVFVGMHWEAFPDVSRGGWPVPCALTSNYGADAEEIPDDQLVPLAALVDAFGEDAVEAWVCHRRGIERPVKGVLSDRGRAALERLRSAELTSTNG